MEEVCFTQNGVACGGGGRANGYNSNILKTITRVSLNWHHGQHGHRCSYAALFYTPCFMLSAGSHCA